MDKKEEQPVLEQVKLTDDDDGKVWGFEPAGPLSSE